MVERPSKSVTGKDFRGGRFPRPAQRWTLDESIQRDVVSVTLITDSKSSLLIFQWSDKVYTLVSTFDSLTSTNSSPFPPHPIYLLSHYACTPLVSILIHAKSTPVLIFLLASIA